MTETFYKGINHTIQIDNDNYSFCNICNKSISGTNITDLINHVLSEHNYKILHIGSQTDRNTDNESLFHATIAILGK